MGKSVTPGLLAGSGLSSLRSDAGPPKTLRDLILETEGYALQQMREELFPQGVIIAEGAQLYNPGENRREYRAEIRACGPGSQRRYEATTYYGPENQGQRADRIIYSGQNLQQALKMASAIVAKKLKKGYQSKTPGQEPFPSESEVINAHKQYF